MNHTRLAGCLCDWAGQANQHSSFWVIQSHTTVCREISGMEKQQQQQQLRDCRSIYCYSGRLCLAALAHPARELVRFLWRWDKASASAAMRLRCGCTLAAQRRSVTIRAAVECLSIKPPLICELFMLWPSSFLISLFILARQPLIFNLCTSGKSCTHLNSDRFVCILYLYCGNLMRHISKKLLSVC